MSSTSLAMQSERGRQPRMTVVALQQQQLQQRRQRR
jgi:hypothetical protein